MSQPRRRPRPENVSGDFFVDHTCIDCDLCRWMSPNVFGRRGSQSAVTKQPENAEERKNTLQALVSCPTFSIHANNIEKGELQNVHSTFPISVSYCEDIFFCGFADEKTFAATSYFIRHPKGNILVDVPRYAPALTKRIDEMGGIQYIFMTHIDDVGDHKKWAEKYKAIRIMHKADINYRTDDVEIQLEGTGPWHIGENGEYDDIELIHTPGHTEGSLTLFHKPSKTLFTGDHFAYSNREGGLSIFPRYNDYSIDVQLENVKTLLDLDFIRILPGHGRRVEFKDYDDRNEQILSFLSSKGH